MRASSPGRWRGYGPAFWVAAFWMGLVVSAAVSASWLPLDADTFDPLNGYRSPSWAHPFGTTRLGEDVFANVVHGARVALITGVVAAVIAVGMGATIGIAAGYFRGPLDSLVTTFLDALSAFPSFVLASALVLYLGQELTTVVFVIGVLSVPALARVARTAALAIADRDFVLAARGSGARHRRIIIIELLPNLAVPLAAFSLYVAGVAILAEGALSFVGLGAPISAKSWGWLIAGGREDLERAWWWSLCPSAVFFLTILSLNYLNDRLSGRWLRGRPMPRAQPVVAQPAPMSAPVSPPVSGAVSALVPGAVSSPGPSPDAGGDEGAVLRIVGLRTYLATPFGPVKAVDGVDLEVRRGELLAVVGESGSGKTMLARSVLGVAPDNAAITGQVWLEGTDLRTLGGEGLRRRRGREVAMVFQDPMTALDPVMRVGWQVAEPARVHLGLSKAFARDLALELLSAVGVPDPERRFNQYPHQLSGGLRQRVAIATAISCGPKVLIADEPTSALDVTVQAQILALLDRLRRERKMAVVLITHDLGVVAAHADRVAVMYAGRVVEQGPTVELFASPRMPYTEALLRSAPRLSDLAGGRRLSIPGQPPNLLLLPPGCAFAPRCSYASDRCSLERPALVADETQRSSAGASQRRGLAERTEGRSVACWHPIAPAERARPSVPGGA